jgi:hypothetical protein
VVVQRPPGVGVFQFVVLASLRAAQLTRGCRPRVDDVQHKVAVIAQLEVAEGKVRQESSSSPTPGESITSGGAISDEAPAIVKTP